MNKTILTGLFIAVILLSCTPGRKDYCGSTDKRFTCTGYLGMDDNYIVFNSVPVGVYTLQKPYLRMEGEDKRTDCTQVIKDGTGNNVIEKAKKYYFDCIPKIPGRYDMDMKIMHAEPGSYQPVSGETCLLMSIGGQRRWDCTASAYYAVTVE